ncbi:hypothetical protein ACSSS7_001948 [Eimeria intestinalis]
MVADCNWRGLVFASGEEIRVVGRQHLNRAFEGDVVAVEILSADDAEKAPNKNDATTHACAPAAPPPSPPAPAGAAAAAACTEEGYDVSADLKDVDEEADVFPDEDGEATPATATPATATPATATPATATAATATAATVAAAAAAPLREGRIVGIIRRGRREFCGTLKPIDDLKGLSMPCVASIERVFVPADRRIPNVLIKGHWVEILGAFGNRKAEGPVFFTPYSRFFKNCFFYMFLLYD